MSRDQQNRVLAAEQTTKNYSVLVKGIIAIMLTVLVVTIVTMLFAKSLFMTNTSEERKTGRLTAPPNYTTISTTTSVTTTTKKTTSRKKEYDPYQEEIAKTGMTEMTVKNAVKLRKEPNSDSEVITVLPANAKVTAYSVTNGNWIYVEYSGKTGYAYGDFFEGEKPTAES
ncbi:MAG: SH3 domain-containing protein [Ruminococcus sp.]|nr:SH3 domain-containing protein [Ruminococcus sp.]